MHFISLLLNIGLSGRLGIFLLVLFNDFILLSFESSFHFDYFDEKKK